MDNNNTPWTETDSEDWNCEDGNAQNTNPTSDTPWSECDSEQWTWTEEHGAPESN